MEDDARRRRVTGNQRYHVAAESDLFVVEGGAALGRLPATMPRARAARRALARRAAVLRCGSPLELELEPG